jgi:glycolate oxidase
MERTRLIAALEQIVGPAGVIARAADLMNYESDGTIAAHLPNVVVLPTSTRQVVEIVTLANRENISIVPRGAGTGLAGGAVSTQHGIVIATTRMNRVLQVDYRNRRAVVEPGVINLDLSLAIAQDGYFYAPDPSSQRACTIGGNVATNSGGPHCFAYGVTSNHVLGLEMVTPTGEVIHTGGWAWDAPGYDLTGLMVGSEGTLGIVTKVIVRIVRQPEAVRVLLGIFDNVIDASETVSAVVAQGILPSAMEMMDALTCEAVEAAYHVGFPPGATVLLIEIDGLTDGLPETLQHVERLCYRHGARAVRLSASAEESAALWNARKSAFGAMGRLAPNYYLQDGVVPRTKLPVTLRRVEEVSRDFRLKIANVFHAGDGNLHPIILFDRRNPGEIERALSAAVETLRACIDVGGAVSGEHGIGLEKKKQLPLVFTTEDLCVMAGLKKSFNPRDLFNPDKIFPSSRGCMEIQQIKMDAAGQAARAAVAGTGEGH